MTIWKWITAMCVLSGFLGLTQDSEKAGAVPAPCPQFKCKTVSYWWDASTTFIRARDFT